MSLQIGAKPDHGFDNPTDLLSDCHRRIKRFLNKIILLAEHHECRALPEEQLHSLDVALRYFRKAAPMHTRDERDPHFPRILRTESAEAEKVMTVMDSLEQDHHVTELLHRTVDMAGPRWMDEGSLDLNSLA